MYFSHHTGTIDEIISRATITVIVTKYPVSEKLCVFITSLTIYFI